MKSNLSITGLKSRNIVSRLLLVICFCFSLSGDLSAAQVVLTGMPTYTWWYGCTPTSGGMLVGYWDSHGYNFVPGDISTFNAAAKNMISSPEHLTDYWIAYNNMGPDPNPDGTHADNCLADFLKTSRSLLGLGDGWTSSAFMDSGMENFASFVGLTFSSTEYYTPEFWGPGTFNYNTLKSEINAGRPLLLNTMVPGGGHTVAIDGFKDNGPGDQWVAVHDTWSDGIGGTSGVIGATTDGTNEWWPWLTDTSGSFYVYGGLTFVNSGSAPEPSTLILFSMGAFFLMRRQRNMAKT